MSKRNWVLAIVAALVLGTAALAYWRPFGQKTETKSAALFTVRRGPLTISVTESGAVKNREQVVVKSEVEGRTSVLALAAEGTTVQPGDLLVELDSSKLIEQKDGQQIKVDNAEATFIRAREVLAVAESQAESDISRAELDVKFARLDLNKYLEGEYPQQQQQAEADITIADEEVRRAEEKLEWSKKLHAQRYLSLMELQADELALKKARLNLELAQSKKQVLEQYTHQRNLEALQSDVSQAIQALDRVKRQATADLVKAKADLKARKSEFERQKMQLEKLKSQIKKCKIYAPVSGMVVYATTGRASWRGNAEPLEEGKEVRQRQELIYLPTAASMMVEVKIHESSLEKVKLGMPARVTVEAAAGRSFDGTVQKIALLPDAQSAWMNPDLKVYNSEIHLTGTAEDLRAGMSCRAEIFVATYKDAVYVPVQSVVREAGNPTVYVQEPGAAEPEPRLIEIGLDNNRMVHVLSGLEPGEKVMLAPPLSAASRAAPKEAPPPGTSTKPQPETGEKTKPKPDAKKRTGGDATDWRERMKNMSPEERKKLMEKYSGRGGGRGGRSPSGG